MLDRKVFDRILGQLYEGYGKTIKEGQLVIMYSRLDYMTEQELKAAAHRWIDHERFPPTVACLNKLTGKTKTREEEQELICPDCSKEAKYVYTVGDGDHRKQICSACFYTILDDAKQTEAHVH